MALMQDAMAMAQQAPTPEQVPPTPSEVSGPSAASPPMPSGAPSADEGALDPQQVETFLDKAFQVIYGGDTEEGDLSSPVASMLRGGGGNANDPEQALASTAAQVAAKVVGSASDNKVSLDPAAVFAGMMELVGELAGVAEREGLYEYGQEEIDAAAIRSGEMLYALTQDSGLWPQEEMVRDAGSIVEASQSGEMDQAITELQGKGVSTSEAAGGDAIGPIMQGAM